MKPNYKVFERLLMLKSVKTADVCKATGISSATFSNWKQGKYAPKNDKISLIAEYFDVAPWSFFGEPEDLEFRHGQSVFEVSAGPGRINSSPSEYVNDGSENTYARVHGDSMLPVLHDGDIVVVAPVYDRPDPSDFTVVRIDGEAETIKHVEFADDGVWLKAENKEVFPDRFYSLQEVMTLPVQIIGKAIEFRREL